MMSREQATRICTGNSVPRLHGCKSEFSGTIMQVTCLSHVRFQGSECGGVVPHACTCLSHAKLQGSESE